MSNVASEYITDAVHRIIANDNNEYDGRGNITRVGLYHGTRAVIMHAYVEAYDNETNPAAGYRHAMARVMAQDALAEYMSDQIDDLALDNMFVQTLVQSAFDLIDWRDLTRSILDSIGENRDGYYDLNQNGKDAIVLGICREETR